MAAALSKISSSVPSFNEEVITEDRMRTIDVAARENCKDKGAYNNSSNDSKVYYSERQHPLLLVCLN